MMTLRVGTRGSDLALWQTNWVCDRLREFHPTLTIERIVIRTHGDAVADQNFGAAWPAGAFVGAIEQALAAEQIDFAVHSYKDLPTAPTPHLTVAATPAREIVHDVLLTRGAERLADLPPGARIGTNSPRRAAQLLQLGEFDVVPVRGNVPTRIDKIAREGLDGVILAAAGLKRLGIKHPHVIELPTDRFLPAPAQGALAVQARGNSPVVAVLAVIDHSETRRAVDAERSLLRRINAGCHTPVGALAAVQGQSVLLRGRLFSDDYRRCVEGEESGRDPQEVGSRLARRLLDKLKGLS